MNELYVIIFYRIAVPAPDGERLALHESLDRLAEAHPERVALVRFRYFAGPTADEAATALRTSPSTADRHRTCAWLRRATSPDTTDT